MKFLIGSFARVGVVVIFLGMVVWGMGWLGRVEVRSRRVEFSAEVVKEAEAGRDVRFSKDVSKVPVVEREMKVEARGESPIFGELVRAGKLPRVGERMPKEPVVIVGTEGVGKYGGTWERFVNSELDISITANSRLAGTYLCRWSPLGYPIVPHVAKSVTGSADGRVWTIKLREGMRWSNGDLYTADDILYWWDEEVLNSYMANGVAGDWMTRGGGLPRFEKVGDYEVRVTFDDPNPLFLETCASRMELTGLPSKYLRKYHPDPAIGDAGVIERDMKAYKQASVPALYGYVKRWQNPELPSLWPWVYREERSTPPQVLVRNPYYFAVDAAGNQLPYLDRLRFQVKDEAMMTIAVANGEATMQDRNINFADYTEIMSRREQAGTRVLQWYPGTRQNWVINPNLNRKVLDAVTGEKGKLLADKRFRQALSMAIDRKQIITAEYYGVGEPSQVSPGEMSDFENGDLAKRYTAFEPEKANALLDELGLTKRDGEGYRTFGDGSRLTFFIDYTSYTGDGPVQFVVDDWKRVGIRAAPRLESRLLFYNNKGSGDYDFCVWTSESDFVPLVSPREWVALNSESMYATGWGRWFYHGGLQGDERAKLPGMVEPNAEMMAALKLYERAIRTVAHGEQVGLFRKIQDIATENVWTIGIATAPPVLVVVDKHLRNVPERALAGLIFSNPSNCGMESFYFDDGRGSGDAAEVMGAIVNPVHGGEAAEGGWVKVVVRIGVWVVLLGLVVMAAVRHPLVGRRLLIMAPMLLVISVIVFGIMRLPGIDFVTTQIARVEASGDATAARQVEDLKRTFHTDDGAFVNYCRWMGFKWLVSFKAEDEGLLEGNLGRSMETGLPVNEVVEQRMMLTLWVGIAAAAVAALIGMPLGIYSAVKAHSFGEHVVTVGAFAAMSVPPFLLALVLMAWMNSVGSGEGVRNLWVPVLVLAAGSAAYMIRIMRANLMDELGKGYVVAARARGMGPVRLLLKYPVRMAINPFVSSLGAQFVLLLSGGAVVGIVLSLPMVSPYLVNALTAEDTYLAGSLLMVLALFGAAGTLASDLLLLRLDPRIRMMGESR